MIGVIALFVLALIVFVVFVARWTTKTQVGGYYDDDDEDPYRNIRFWKIIDFFRGFWFTR